VLSLASEARDDFSFDSFVVASMSFVKAFAQFHDDAHAFVDEGTAVCHYVLSCYEMISIYGRIHEYRHLVW
jgi:hypothetical protein